jgi:hypothetical protein
MPAVSYCTDSRRVSNRRPALTLTERPHPCHSRAMTQSRMEASGKRAPLACWSPRSAETDFPDAPPRVPTTSRSVTALPTNKEMRLLLKLVAALANGERAVERSVRTSKVTAALSAGRSPSMFDVPPAGASMVAGRPVRPSTLPTQPSPHPPLPTSAHYIYCESSL